MGINRDPPLGLLYLTADGWNITHVAVMSFVGLASFTTPASLNPHPNVSTLYSAPQNSTRGATIALFCIDISYSLRSGPCSVALSEPVHDLSG